MKKYIIISVIAAFSITLTMFTHVWAQPITQNSVQTETKPQDEADMTSGEVRKIDKDAGKVTLKHGRIENLDMPGMTMVFKATDKSMLDQIKVGDKVKFIARETNGNLTVTDIKIDK